MPEIIRRICVVTSTRAEYGILKPLMHLISDADGAELQLIVTGTHLDKRHGTTVAFIREDGFEPNAEIPLPLGEGRCSAADTAATCLGSMAPVLSQIQPDILVVVGDRYEILATVFAASLLNIPIAHIHGGEVTVGAMDDVFRHAITKMAHLHFTACETYRQRVIQMGEDPAHVFNFGAPGIDTIATTPVYNLPWLSSHVGFELDVPFFLVTYHATTRTLKEDEHAVAALVDIFEELTDFKVLITGTNADPGHKEISAMFERLVAAYPGRIAMRASLGQSSYVTAMRLCAAVIGNSSSGIIEAPFIGAPTVNIGSRQDGRERALSVIDCEPSYEAIAAAIREVISLSFKTVSKRGSDLFGTGGASQRIADKLLESPFGKMKSKPFFDIKFKVQSKTNSNELEVV